jgi:hypothetical protein
MRSMIPQELNPPGFNFFILSVLYITGFTTPIIYNKFLQLGVLEKMSLTVGSHGGLEAKDIIQIDATVIVGALLLLTLQQVQPASDETLPQSNGRTIGSDKNDEPQPGYLLSKLGNITPSRLVVNMTGTIVVIFAFSAVTASIFK